MTDGFADWLTNECGLTHYQIIPLAGDASFRCYFRIQCEDKSYIAMDASAERASCVPYVAIADALRQEGLVTPAILVRDLDRGWLLISDFGDQLYLNALTTQNAKALYEKALDALLTLQHCSYPAPDFTAERMRQELDLFKEWFLEKHLGLHVGDQLNSCFDFLANAAALQPQVFMHRDYHSANLMVLLEGGVGLLDFQDAFRGPITYDLVSLLRDCYIAWPDAFVTELALYFWKKCALPDVSAELFLRWFDLMGIQRHLKALLTFSRKYHRDGNANYLQHIPRTLQYVKAISQRYPECHLLTECLETIPCAG